jgi:GGDEF domain-containing protein
MPLRVRIVTALDLANAAPVDGRRISILLIAGDHTTLAADAFGHVEMEPVLLAGARLALRHQRSRDLYEAAGGGVDELSIK